MVENEVLQNLGEICGSCVQPCVSYKYYVRELEYQQGTAKSLFNDSENALDGSLWFRLISDRIQVKHFLRKANGSALGKFYYPFVMSCDIP